MSEIDFLHGIKVRQRKYQRIQRQQNTKIRTWGRKKFPELYKKLKG